MEKWNKVIMVTGGAGFIGSHLVKKLVFNHPDWLIYNVDKLTYAGNLENVKECENRANYRFFQFDICDPLNISRLFNENSIIISKNEAVTDIIHLAAESHVDNSISNPLNFAMTNVIGTLNLLDIAHFYWEKDDLDKHRFHHVSTDEVYGALKIGEKPFKEENKYFPHSPYSASKASSDHFVRAYHDTFGLNVTISNCSNNYGPNQYPEKLIPLVVNRLMHKERIPVYGDGTNIRDWIYVGDHCDAIEKIFLYGKNGETYNIGGNNEISNIEIINNIIKCYSLITGKSPDEYYSLITFVKDRPGHDFRYAIDNEKIKNELGWEPTKKFDDGIFETVKWFCENGK